MKPLAAIGSLSRTRRAALLGGLNVGGNRSVSLSDLRHVFQSAGFAEVSTYIQSGNVLFTTDEPPGGDDLEAALADRFDLRISVIIRTSEDLLAIVAACPFPATNTKAVHVGFMAQVADARAEGWGALASARRSGAPVRLVPTRARRRCSRRCVVRSIIP